MKVSEKNWRAFRQLLVDVDTEAEKLCAQLRSLPEHARTPEFKPSNVLDEFDEMRAAVESDDPLLNLLQPARDRLARAHSRVFDGFFVGFMLAWFTSRRLSARALEALGPRP